MRKETREVYVCEHCGKLCRTAAACGKHEKTCRKNPAYMLACYDCENRKVANWLAKEVRLVTDGESRLVEDVRCAVGGELLLSPHLSFAWLYEGCEAQDGTTVKLCPTVEEGCKHFRKI